MAGVTQQFDYKAVTNKQIADSCRKMATEVERRFGKPNCIAFGIRGGMVPARLLADELGCKELVAIRARKFQHIGEDKGVVIDNSSLEQLRGLNLQAGSIVLLVDDISGTGDTLKMMRDGVANVLPNVKIVTATLASMPGSKFPPDVTSFTVSDNSWLVFEFEVAETLRDFENDGNSAGAAWLKNAFSLGP